ncbi:MAG: hypothetical protein V4694_05410 [Pseudomonadota bacterium]
MAEKSLGLYETLLGEFPDSGTEEQKDNNLERRSNLISSLMTELSEKKGSIQNLVWHAMLKGCENLRQAVFEYLPEKEVKEMQFKMFCKISNSPNYLIPDKFYEVLCREVPPQEVQNAIIRKATNLQYRPLSDEVLNEIFTPEQLQEIANNHSVQRVNFYSPILVKKTYEQIEDPQLKLDYKLFVLQWTQNPEIATELLATISPQDIIEKQDELFKILAFGSLASDRILEIVGKEVAANLIEKLTDYTPKTIIHYAATNQQIKLIRSLYPYLNEEEKLAIHIDDLLNPDQPAIIDFAFEQVANDQEEFFMDLKILVTSNFEVENFNQFFSKVSDENVSGIVRRDNFALLKTPMINFESCAIIIDRMSLPDRKDFLTHLTLEQKEDNAKLESHYLWSKENILPHLMDQRKARLKTYALLNESSPEFEELLKKRELKLLNGIKRLRQNIESFEFPTIKEQNREKSVNDLLAHYFNQPQSFKNEVNFFTDSANKSNLMNNFPEEIFYHISQEWAGENPNTFYKAEKAHKKTFSQEQFDKPAETPTNKPKSPLIKIEKSNSTKKGM